MLFVCSIIQDNTVTCHVVLGRSTIVPSESCFRSDREPKLASESRAVSCRATWVLLPYASPSVRSTYGGTMVHYRTAMTGVPLSSLVAPCPPCRVWPSQALSSWCQGPRWLLNQFRVFGAGVATGLSWKLGTVYQVRVAVTCHCARDAWGWHEAGMSIWNHSTVA